MPNANHTLCIHCPPDHIPANNNTHCIQCPDKHISSVSVEDGAVCYLDCHKITHCNSSLVKGYSDPMHDCLCNCDLVNCAGGSPFPVLSLYDSCTCDCSTLDCGELGGFVEWDDPCHCNCEDVDCHQGHVTEDCACDCSEVECQNGAQPPSSNGDCSCDCSHVDCGSGRVLLIFPIWHASTLSN